MATPRQGRVLVIAGSDSGGGAGIQADIKTITMAGQYAATAVTAITAQNTMGVSSVMNMAPDLVAEQIRMILSDLGADVIKTGMLGSADIVRACMDVAAECDFQGQWVIDPVMVATSGDRLASDEAVTAIQDTLIPVADIITPNIPEAEILAGMAIETPDDMETAARYILEKGAKSVLMKGGHLAGDQLIDLLVTEAETVRFDCLRIPGQNTHGTGCTLASAIAALLAAGCTLLEAVETGRYYVRRAIENAPGFGRGYGPLGHAVTPLREE